MSTTARWNGSSPPVEGSGVDVDQSLIPTPSDLVRNTNHAAMQTQSLGAAYKLCSRRAVSVGP
jgi:hypothetical protein